MKWKPGGWQRADAVDPERATTPRRTSPYAEQQTRAYSPPSPPQQQPQRTMISSEARDVDVSAASFRNLLVGGGLSGFGVVVCAAVLVDGGGPWLWVAQLLTFVVFLYFVASSRGVLSSRGFLFDGSGFYARTRGEVCGVAWSEISAVGIGTLPMIEHKRPVHPERRRALEVYPADPGFGERHPELDRWLVEDRPPMQGLPGVRYRFHLPPMNRMPRDLERAVQAFASRKWVGQYRRHTPPPGS
ncbi:hypothetical protein GIY23_17930 [Allosaccharopolyspora coralli]|uniref:Uncharacterized protein n=1 Tax=Allosaccharopolyspora coralli TaxID=2665642 RepID=A0A5Q3QJZ5_9PSEU|nr:hypothetical protein [Allosaccharopolyspora coralli]QGK71147.1 hypothetical protein GIY23_17930 [Allosaccharopolyspora coralli]